MKTIEEVIKNKSRLIGGKKEIIIFGNDYGKTTSVNQFI